MLVVLQACSGAAAAKPDACKLIDPAAAAKVLGTKVTMKPVDTSAAGPDAASLCSYQTGRVHGGFLLAAVRLDAKNLPAEVADQKKDAANSTGAPGANMPKPQVSDVAGLGDAAFLVATDFFFELHVFAHGDKLVLTRNVKPDASAIAQAKALAGLAVANLP